MPRLETIKLTIRTGVHGMPDIPKYSINGFPLDFEEVYGSAQPGETLELVGNPESYPHSLTLQGPRDGEWDIEGIEAEYHCAVGDPYMVRLGAITLDHESDLNIWHERPPHVFDV